MDFTCKIYKQLINTLNDQGFSFLPFKEFSSKMAGKVIVLRHDVDALNRNSLQFARIQADKGIKGTFYFRIVTESFDENIIKEIYSMGHEVGYHYEDLSFAWAKLKAQGSGHRAQGEELEKVLVEIGIESFANNLGKLRKIIPVKTICMHGSPMSRWDSRLLWKYYDYHDFGIVGEPYFDIDFDEVLYLTDTGRRWDGRLVSVRDKAQGTGFRAQGKDPFEFWKVKPIKNEAKYAKEEGSGHRAQGTGNWYEGNRVPHTAFRKPFPRFHSTFDIIKAAEEGRLPDKIMITFHPQRWTDKPLQWVKELVWQNVKNVGKYFLVKLRD